MSAGSPHATLIRGVYLHMPGAFRTSSAVEVREVTDTEIERLASRDELGRSGAEADDPTTVDGYFRSFGRHDKRVTIITLRRTLGESNAAFVFTHEYGHCVWYGMLSQRQRALYGRLWRHQADAGSLVTSYAGTSVEEGFAEAFAHYLRRPDLLRESDEASFLFMRDLAQPRWRRQSSPRGEAGRHSHKAQGAGR